VTDTKQTSGLPNNQQAVLDLLLERSPEFVSPTKIARLLHPNTGRYSSWASPICKRLVDLGGLERNEKGHYRVKPSVIIGDKL